MSNALNKKDIKERLYIFLYITSKSKSEFAKKLKISRQNLHAYLEGEFDIQKLSASLHKLGCSIDWLYSGEGSCFNKTNNGIELRTNHINDNLELNTIKKRIKYWILKYYDSFRKFEKINDLDRNTIEYILESEVIFNYKLITLLKKNGCNTDWTLSGIGPECNNSKIGKKLKKENKNENT